MQDEAKILLTLNEKALEVEVEHIRKNGKTLQKRQPYTAPSVKAVMSDVEKTKKLIQDVEKQQEQEEQTKRKELEETLKSERQDKLSQQGVNLDDFAPKIVEIDESKPVIPSPYSCSVKETDWSHWTCKRLTEKISGKHSLQ